MVIKTPKKNPKYKHMSLAQRGAQRVANTVDYINKDGKLEQPVHTNLAGQSRDDFVAELEAWKTLNPKITDPVEHRVFSFEKLDRDPTAEDIRRAVDIFREERGLDDAPFIAFRHDDGHDDRHPTHVHLMYLRIKSDGKSVPTSRDSTVHRRASRRIEKELGLIVNAGADESHKYNGRDKRIQQERGAEREGIPMDRWHVDPSKVSEAIAKSRNIGELRAHLRERGIDMRTREKQGETYAWQLRNFDGPKGWTDGSKLTQSNEFGWGKVKKALDEKRAKAPGIKLSTIQPDRRWPAPRRRLRIDNSSKAPPATKKPQPVDIGQAVDDGFEILGEIVAAANRDASRAVKRIPVNPGIKAGQEAVQRAADQARRAAVKRSTNPIKHTG